MKTSKPKDKTRDKEKEKDKPKNPSNPQKNRSKPSTVVDYATDALGSGYVFGSSGQVLTNSGHRQFKRDHPKEVTNLSKKWKNKRVFDCSGLVLKSFEQIGIKLPHNADEAWRTTKWQQKGDMSNLPKDKVCILYRMGKNKMVHTAIYCGDGTVIEASGEEKGVIRTKYDSSKWKNWGIPEGLY
jgi:cell wall-associated NlpC family hydrolase